MTDTIEWRLRNPKLDGGLKSDRKWTTFCQLVTDEKTQMGTAMIVVAALNKDSEPPIMEYRIKKRVKK